MPASAAAPPDRAAAGAVGLTPNVTARTAGQPKSSIAVLHCRRRSSAPSAEGIIQYRCRSRSPQTRQPRREAGRKAGAPDSPGITPVPSLLPARCPRSLESRTVSPGDLNRSARCLAGSRSEQAVSSSYRFVQTDRGACCTPKPTAAGRRAVAGVRAAVGLSRQRLAGVVVRSAWRGECRYSKLPARRDSRCRHSRKRPVFVRKTESPITPPSLACRRADSGDRPAGSAQGCWRRRPDIRLAADECRSRFASSRRMSRSEIPQAESGE